ncbi:MAG: CHAT domain-containing protein [Gammaproteobacteria bacterium]|nr:CHAT domain-containing protein [Gammaproteobacteria bacterium]
MKYKIAFLILMIWGGVFVHPVNAAEPANAASVGFEDLLSQGDVFFRQGRFQEAAARWKKSLAEDGKEASRRIDVLSRLAGAYQAIGMHSEVFKVLDEAVGLAEQSEDAQRSALVLSQLSDAWLTIGDPGEALAVADESVEDARKAQQAAVLARAFNSQGNALAVLEDFEPAIKSYRESAKYAEQAGDANLAAKASINRVNAAVSSAAFQQARKGLNEVWSRIEKLPDSHDKASAYISAGVLAQRLAQHADLSENQTGAELLRANRAYGQAARIAGDLDDARSASIAYGRQGSLYESERRNSEALELTAKAIFFAEQGRHPDILYQWQWQQGRILKALGKTDEAINAYTLAAVTLKPIQQILDIGYRSAPGSFDETVRPVYYELADLLLKKAETANDKEERQRLLKSARATVESVKAAELQNYFHDDCVLAMQGKSTDLDNVAPNTAILYPITLPDRLALVVTLPDGLYQAVVPVGSGELDDALWKLRMGLQTRPNNRFVHTAKKMYNWIIRPIESLLENHKVDTLVVIPDGRLRTIPLSVLHDGKQFLIENYAVVTTPGLSLTAPGAISWQDSEMFLAGLSEAVQEYSALPSVPKELKSIEEIVGHSIKGGTKVLNKEYSIASFTDAMKATEFSIVHMATHGHFGGTPEDTYLLTYEEKMSIDKLQQIIGLGRFRDKPIELLTLSACQTALGDDRAALGLAGIAVKAGARSAIATLWFVDDEAASLAVVEFYRQLLENPGLSKAKALQNAQKKLLSQPRYWHPAYWAPFLLIGNWL